MASKKVVPTKPYRPITEARKKAFLEELSRHGVVAQAARVATPHETKTTGASGFYRLRNLDPAFAERWDAAVEQADAALLTEARRRAVEGVERGIFQKGTQATTADGEPATERVYSDRLLELILKPRFPNEYIERRAIESPFENTAQ